MDPDFNPELKSAIDKAKAENMPNDNIDRALKKAAGEGGGKDFESITYEGYGPSGVAVIVEALTDNRNRTAPDVRHAFEKYGGNLGTSGSVTFMFDRLGSIIVEKSEDIDEEELMMQSLEYGADDFESLEDAYEITTSIENFANVRDKLEADGYNLAMSEIGFIPQNYIDLIDEKDISNMEKMIDMLEDNDDIQEIYHNWNNEERL